jgi:AAA family ATP:ADP antiporter
MFTIFLLLSINFTILRSVRNTLAVVDLGAGAQSIPLFELFGAMPAAFLMTAGLASLINRFSKQRVFITTLSIFLVFFLVFALGIYPFLNILRDSGHLNTVVLRLIAMVFYIMSELWKPALGVILFWGLINQYVPQEDAKKMYAPLMVGGSLGSVLAGYLISFSTSDTLLRLMPLSKDPWTHSFMTMILMLVFVGIITGVLFVYLAKQLPILYPERHPKSHIKEKITLKESLRTSFEVPHLRLLGWTVLADYIAYSLGEVIFLEVLKCRFPESRDYCHYLGQLSAWSGAMTLVISLIAPFLLQRCRWVTVALITPVCLLITEGLFFACCLTFGWGEIRWIEMAILFGSLQYCLCRSTKYALLDATKELAFVTMPDSQKMKGKLIVDGICTRMGRGGAAALSLCFVQISGGVLASTLLAAPCALGLGVSWLFCTFKLGRLLNWKNETNPLRTSSH